MAARDGIDRFFELGNGRLPEDVFYNILNIKDSPIPGWSIIQGSDIRILNQIARQPYYMNTYGDFRTFRIFTGPDSSLIYLGL